MVDKLIIIITLHSVELSCIELRVDKKNLNIFDANENKYKSESQVVTPNLKRLSMNFSKKGTVNILCYQQKGLMEFYWGTI